MTYILYIYMYHIIQKNKNTQLHITYLHIRKTEKKAQNTNSVRES